MGVGGCDAKMLEGEVFLGKGFEVSEAKIPRQEALMRLGQEQSVVGANGNVLLKSKD